MKSAIVPAQITTVEDKVAGSLSLSQLLLLATPVFGGSAIYILFPPSLGSSPFKIVIIAAMTVAFSLFAVRIKGKILLQWAIILLRYNFRPRYHVFDKNDLHLRANTVAEEPELVEEETNVKVPEITSVPQVNMTELVKLQHTITDPRAKLHFKTNRKGDLYVHVTEVK